MTISFKEALGQGIKAHRDGKLEDAERIYRSILKTDPNHADANHNLGILALGMNQPKHAVRYLSAALKTNPKIDQFWISYIHVLIRLNKFSEARTTLNKAITYGVHINNFEQLEKKLSEHLKISINAKETIALLAKKYAEGRFKDALILGQKSLRQFPAEPNIPLTLGQINIALGQNMQAVYNYKKALVLLPNHNEIYYLLGVALNKTGGYSDAIKSFLATLVLKRANAEAYNNMGTSQYQLKDFNAAATSYEKAIKLKADYAGAYSNLGNVYNRLYYYDKAIVAYKNAIRIEPTKAVPYLNLGTSFRDVKQFDQAMKRFRQAIVLQPNLSEGYYSLELIINRTKNFLPMAQFAAKALIISPSTLRYQLHSNTIFQRIPFSVKSIEDDRTQYEKGLDQLLNKTSFKRESPEGHGANVFYLPYHNKNNLNLLTKRSELNRRVYTDMDFIAPHIPNWNAPLRRRIKVGFFSEFLRDGHTIGKAYKGLVQKLDRSLFECILIHAPNKNATKNHNAMDSFADNVLWLDNGFIKQLEAIASQKLDVLFFPDIGMSNHTYFCAHARLAPIQIVSTGHPETTGINTIDYFLSSSIVEPLNAESLYSERLIKSSRLPCFYSRPMLPKTDVTRDYFGLPENETLYGSLQSLFKFHPDFDEILEEIVDLDPSARLVFVNDSNTAVSEQLKHRWQKNHRIVADRSIFIPRQNFEKFMSLSSFMDVLLDPLYFGSGNTMYESSGYGIPTVTFPGKYMRGRWVAGSYKQMKIKNAPIANDLKDYAPMAVELGKSDEWRHDLKQQISKASDANLYSDTIFLKEFEKFLLAAVDATDKGVLIEAGWELN